MMRPELFVLLAAACLACPSETPGATDTATASTTTTDTGGAACVEPEFDAGVPLPWSFCGCSNASPWYAHCGDGFFCEQAIKYVSVPPTVLGGTCSPLCATDRDCEPFPFPDAVVECGGHHCEIRCNPAVPCPEGMICQGDNCVHAPGE